MLVMLKANLENSMGLFVLFLFTKCCAHFGYYFLVFYIIVRKNISGSFCVSCFFLTEISPVSFFIAKFNKEKFGHKSCF